MLDKSKTPAAGATAREGRSVLLGKEHIDLTDAGPATQAVHYRGSFLGWIVTRRDNGFDAYARTGDPLGRSNTAHAAAIALLGARAL